MGRRLFRKGPPGLTGNSQGEYVRRSPLPSGVRNPTTARENTSQRITKGSKLQRGGSAHPIKSNIAEPCSWWTKPVVITPTGGKGPHAEKAGLRFYGKGGGPEETHSFGPVVEEWDHVLAGEGEFHANGRHRAVPEKREQPR